MSIKIALAGNPNSGKTTLFNALTGSNQFVGNWPGVTVEKKEGQLKSDKNVTIIDLPGIYSLSPYSLEEVVARNYLIEEHPDVILNIVDGTNLERNLYLTTQLLELGIPVVIAINMMDSVIKAGDKINIEKLSAELRCEVIPISALKGTGITEAAETAVRVANVKKSVHVSKFSEDIENSLKDIESKLGDEVPEEQKRFFAIKLFERDEKIREKLKSDIDVEKIVKDTEEKYDDDAESIITNERYNYITDIITTIYVKKNRSKHTTSDKIDRVVTNRWLALPIFAVVMFLVYYISITTVGSWATDWANDGVFGEGWHLFGIGSADYENAATEYEIQGVIVEAFEEAAISEEIDPSQAKDITTTAFVYDDEGEVEKEIHVTYSMYTEAVEILKEDEPAPSDYGIWIPGIPVLVEKGLESINAAYWLKELILNGIVAGVGAVLGFVPQMLVLFFFLAILEACGYMARIAFIMDRIFRKFGLSGKSFIPILVGTGCGVPGIMASRTIENERDRRMTIITTTFIPCGAKLPIIALIAGAMFDGAPWVAPSAYFAGMAAIVISGIILKKTKMFTGAPAPFVMELPAYHLPLPINVLRSMWERGWSFIKKAGTIILLCTIVIWFFTNFGIKDGQFTMVEDFGDGFLALIGSAIAWIFKPLGWGEWKSAVATLTGLVAKENVVGAFGVLYGVPGVSESGNEIWRAISASYTSLSAYSFLLFNLLCAPCFAAIGAIRREMNSAKWTWFAIGYQTLFAYAVSLVVYQFGMLFTYGEFGIGTVFAIVVFVTFIYLLFKPAKKMHLKKVRV